MSRPLIEPAIRAFAAIEMPPDLMEELRGLQRRFQAALDRGLVRWTRPEQLHLTLRFFGNVDPAGVQDMTAALERACRQTGPFHLCLGSLGCFPSLGRPTIIWVGIGGELNVLRQLQNQIDSETRSFGDPPEERDFHPHVTVGRVKTRVESHAGRASSLPVHGASSPRVSDGRMPPKPAESAPHFRTGSQDARRVGEIMQRIASPNPGDWPVREITLMKSQLSPRGSVYSRLASLALH